MMTDDPDRELTHRLKCGDEDAVADLVAMFGSRIEQLAFQHLRNREDAEEVAQDVILKVVRAIARFRGEAALASWVYRIAFNAAMSRLRQRQAWARREARWDERPTIESYDTQALQPSKEFADWSSLADEMYLCLQLRERLEHALVSLPPIYRVAVELRDLQGLSTAEASQILGVPSQTLKSRLRRGRAILQPRLAEFGVGLSLHSRW